MGGDPWTTPGHLEHAWAGNASRFALFRVESPEGVTFRREAEARVWTHHAIDEKARTLRVDGGATYELGMRERDHGIPIQPYPDG